MTLKQYLKEAEKMILAAGGKVIFSYIPDKGPIIKDFQVSTKLGPLNITPYKDWIVLQFQELSLALDYFPLSSTQFSRVNGKWNIQGVSKQGTVAEYRQTLLNLLKSKLKEVQPYPST